MSDTPDETYAGLLTFVMRELSRRGHVPANVQWPDPGQGHRASSELKVQLLSKAYAAEGPAGIYGLGRGALSLGHDPFMRVLRARRSPEALCQTWARLEAYGHSGNRTVFRRHEEGAVRLERVRRAGGTPTFVESLLIVGLLGALLEAIGAQGLSCTAALADAPHTNVWTSVAGLAGPRPDEARPLTWTLRFTAFSPRAPKGGSGDAQLVDELRARDASGTLPKLVGLLAEDVARSYPIGEAARLLATSTRSLQRRLGEAHCTYASLVRRVRVAAAIELMAKGETPLTMIAYAAGFADGAHMSRDIRRVVGAAPSELRALLCER